MTQTMLDDIYNGKFCKIVIKTDCGDKALKGIVSVFYPFLQIKGDYQTSTIHFSQIMRITKKENGGDEHVRTKQCERKSSIT